MIKHYKVNRALALALSIATASVSLSNTLAYAADQSGAIEKENVQTQAQENVSYFRKLPAIGDTALHINTKKLKEENKLAIGDRLQMKLITGSETYKRILVDSVKEGDIKDDYTTEQIMGPGGRPLIPYREFSAGDVVELYVVRGAQETKVGNITVKGEKSLTPIVEQTKDNIMMSSKMTGSIKMFLHTKKDNQWKIFDLAKENKPNAISYDFPMEKLRETYGASVGDEFVVVHQEANKGKTISKKMVHKDTYDAPNVEFKERANKDESASYTISLPDNPNLDPTPIQNHLPKLKVVKGNETKTFTLNKASMPQELKAVKGGVSYAVPKDTPNNTTFEFSQEGENFNSSKPVTMTYKVDMKKANELMAELNSYPEDKKESFKEPISTIKGKLQKEDRTQQEVDQAVQALDSIILQQLRDSLSSKRQEAIKTVEALQYLDKNKKTTYQAQVTGAKSEKDIAGLVEKAKAEDKQAENAKNAELQGKKDAAIKKIKEEYTFLTGTYEAYKTEIIKKIQDAPTIPEVETFLQEAEAKNQEAKKAQFEQFRKSTLEQIKALENLSDQERRDAEQELNAANDVQSIVAISQKYRNLNTENGVKKNLGTLKEDYKKKLKDLKDLTEEERKGYESEIEQAATGNQIVSIYQRAQDKNIANNKAKAQEAEEAAKALEEQRKVALEKIKALPGLTNEHFTQAENELKSAPDKMKIDEIVNKYTTLSEDTMKKKDLDAAKKEYIGKLETLTLLSSNDKQRFTKEIQEAGTLELVKEAFDAAVQVNLSKAKAAANEKLTKLENLSESEIDAAIQEIMATKALGEIEPIVEKYKKLDQEKAMAKAQLEAARKEAIAAVNKLAHLKQDEMAKFEESIKKATSANEINDIKQQAIRKNDENLAEKNKAQTLEVAKKELGKLVEETKAIKLSQDSKLKQKVEDTLKAAEEALKGQSLDAMNGAIQDVKRVMEEVKKEQEQAPAPKDPKEPSPSEPSPAPNNPLAPKPSKPAPSPSNPAQPSPSKPTVPSPSKPKPSVEPKEKEKPAPRGKWFNFTFQKTTPSKPHTAKTENSGNQAKTYADIQNHWAKEAINYSLESRLFDDIVKGNRFEPNKAMTRAEFIAILGRFEKVNEFTANISFQDIDMNAYYGKYVNWAKNAGLVYGMDAANFAPNKTISREEMATILYRYKQMKKINFEGEAKQYKDGNKIPKWAKEAVQELSKSKILNGMDDGTFQGKKQLSRAEIAQIVYNINKIR